MRAYFGSISIHREKNIKHRSRGWKLELVESGSPQGRDLDTDITR
jgi:predicted GIY-YIG superfamily endonuclease